MTVVEHKPAQAEQHYQRHVSRHFSKAATGYHAHSEIQRLLGERLLAQHAGRFERIVDVGCGPASLTAELMSVSQHYIGLDLSAAMLREAYQRTRQPLAWLTASAEALPLQEESVDGYFANMSLQWCYHLGTALDEMVRVLRPGGTALVSLPVKGTFSELRESFRAIDQHQHTQKFISRGEVEQLLTRYPACQVSLRTDTDQQWFSSVTAALKSIKGVGANYVVRDQQQGLLSPRQYARMTQRYQGFRTSKGIPLSWKTLQIKLEK